MATVPSPITFVAGNKLTAAQLNTNVRDAVNFLVAPPAAVARNTVGTSIANTLWTALVLDTELLDSDNMHSTSTNTERFTAVTAGWYEVIAACEFAQTSTAGGRQIRIVTQSGATPTTVGSNSVAGTTSPAVSVSAMAFLAVGDWVRGEVLQSSGGALALIGTPTIGDNRVSVRWCHS